MSQPALPKRPKSPFSGQLDEVKSAFPDVDPAVARAVVVAAAGNLENAFNGLLALNDDTIRPPPPVEVQSERHRQLARDEQLARELASGRRRQQPLPPRPQDNDDLSIDEIRDNLQKWGNEASKNIGSFFNNIKQRITEMGPEEVDEDYYGRVDSSSARASRSEAFRQVRDQRRGSDDFITMEYEEAPPKPKRPTDKPVNAFGEDKPARWEPLRQTTDSDAFFIGESDEDVDEDEEDRAGKEAEPKESAEPKAKAKDSDESKVLDSEPKEAKSKESKSKSKSNESTSDESKPKESKPDKSDSKLKESTPSSEKSENNSKDTPKSDDSDTKSKDSDKDKDSKDA